MAIEHSQWLGGVTVLGIQLGDGLKMRLSRQCVHRNVGSWAAALLVPLNAPHNARTVAGTGHQIGSTIVQRKAGDDVQVPCHRGYSFALVQIVDTQRIVPDAAGIEKLPIGADRKVLRVRRL